MKEATEREIRLMFNKFRKDLIKSEEWFSWLDNNVIDKKISLKVIKSFGPAEDRLNDYVNSRYFKMKIRKYCNFHGYSDVHAFEVVSIKSPRKVIIRAMRTEQTVKPTEFHAGGFSAHCADNHNQEYNYFSDENNVGKVITLTKKGWGNGSFIMSDEPIKFYDYNF